MRWDNAKKLRRVRSEARGVAGRLQAKVGVRPQVPHRDWAGDTQLAPGCGDSGRRVGQVEQGDRVAAVMVISEPDLLLCGLRYRECGMAGLVDGDRLGVGEQRQVERVELGQVGAQQQRRGLNGPQSQHGLPLVPGEAVGSPVADLNGVQVVPVAGTGKRHPLGHVSEPQGHAHSEVSQAGAVAVAFNVSGDAPTVAVALPGGRIGEAERVRQFQVHGTASSQDRLVPMFDVDPVICSDDTAAWADKVHLNVVDTPRREYIRLRLYVGGRTRLGVVDSRGAVIRGVAGQAGVGDIADVVRGPLDRRVRGHRGGRDAGYQVDAKLQAKRVHVLGDRGDAVRELLRVPGHPAVLIDAAVPFGVDVDVLVTILLQIVMQSQGLRLNGGRTDAPAQRTPTAPSHGWA